MCNRNQNRNHVKKKQKRKHTPKKYPCTFFSSQRDSDKERADIGQPITTRETEYMTDWVQPVRETVLWVDSDVSADFVSSDGRGSEFPSDWRPLEEVLEEGKVDDLD